MQRMQYKEIAYDSKKSKLFEQIRIFVHFINLIQEISFCYMT